MQKDYISIDAFDMPMDSFVNIRSPLIAFLIIAYYARQGGEPVQLQLHQWQEAIVEVWVDK